MYEQATDDLGRTFNSGDYVEIGGLRDSFRRVKAYIYSMEWWEPRVTHTEGYGLYLRGGWDMTLVDAPDAKPETGLVTRWKQGEDGGQVTLIEKRVIQEKI